MSSVGTLGLLACEGARVLLVVCDNLSVIGAKVLPFDYFVSGVRVLLVV